MPGHGTRGGSGRRASLELGWSGASAPDAARTDARDARSRSARPGARRSDLPDARPARSRRVVAGVAARAPGRHRLRALPRCAGLGACREYGRRAAGEVRGFAVAYAPDRRVCARGAVARGAGRRLCRPHDQHRHGRLVFRAGAQCGRRVAGRGRGLRGRASHRSDRGCDGAQPGDQHRASPLRPPHRWRFAQHSQPGTASCSEGASVRLRHRRHRRNPRPRRAVLSVQLQSPHGRGFRHRPRRRGGCYKRLGYQRVPGARSNAGFRRPVSLRGARGRRRHPLAARRDAAIHQALQSVRSRTWANAVRVRDDLYGFRDHPHPGGHLVGPLVC